MSLRFSLLAAQALLIAGVLAALPVRADPPPLPGMPATPPAAPTVLTPAPLPLPPPPPATPNDPLAGVYLQGLQRGLPSHGYHPGPETGMLDERTRDAILQYEHDAGLPEEVDSAMALKRVLDSVNLQYPPVMAGRGE